MLGHHHSLRLVLGLTKQLIKLATAAAILNQSPRVTEYGEYRLALRAAFDCIHTAFFVRVLRLKLQGLGY